MDKTKEQDKTMASKALSAEAYEIIEARSHDPFAYLGRHAHPDGGVLIRAFLPRAAKAWVLVEGGKAKP
ncbi:MAG: hypothetical protein R8K46_07370, partial [Mariprofundaceae bacterium]